MTTTTVDSDRRAAVITAARRALGGYIAHYGLPQPERVDAVGRNLHVLLNAAQDLAPWAHTLHSQIFVTRDYADDGAVQWTVELAPDRLHFSGVAVYVAWVGPWIPAGTVPQVYADAAAVR